MKFILNKKFLGLLYCCVSVPVMLFLVVMIISLFFSFLNYLKVDEFIFDQKNFSIAYKLALLGFPIGIVFWYLECRRLNIRIPFINDNKITRWVDAANHIADDINSKVVCPECRKAILKISSSFDEKDGEIRHMNCPECSVYHAIRMKAESS